MEFAVLLLEQVPCVAATFVSTHVALCLMLADQAEIVYLCFRQVKSCLVFEKTAVPAARTPWVLGRDQWWQMEVRAFASHAFSMSA